MAEARDIARQKIASLAAGIDPDRVEVEEQRAAERQQQIEERGTFRAVAQAYMDERQHLRSRHEIERKLANEVLPVIGDLPVADLQRADVKDMITRQAKRAPVAANRTLSLTRAILNFAVDEELV